jgi:hypothetical protein
MKLRSIWTCIGLLAWMSLGLPAQALSSESRLTADLTVASKYVTGGYQIGGDDPVMQPSVSYELGKGFSLMAWSALRMDRTQREFDEVDLFGRYSKDLFQGSAHALNLHGFYDFWFYPGSGANMRKGNKLHAGASLPELIPLAGSHLVPSYNAYYWIYWDQNRRDRYQGGAQHEFLLQYAHELPRFFSAAPVYVGASGSVSYGDGAFDTRPGWSHSIAQLGSSVYFRDWTLSLSLNRQWTYQATVNPSNELWSMLSVTRAI